MKRVKDIVMIIGIVLIIFAGVIVPITMELSRDITKAVQSEDFQKLCERVLNLEISDSNELPNPEFSFPDLIQQSLKSVVHIKCPQWQGSGFVMGKHIIVTARHVIDGVEDFEITTYNGEKLHATRAISDKKHDVGFIYIDDLRCTLPVSEHSKEFHGTFFGLDHLVKLHPVEFGGVKDCRLGQEIYSIGSPYGKINFNNVTKGIISGLDKNWDETNSYAGRKYGWEVAFTTDSANHPGNSGCPIFTMDGKVRGILVGGFSPVLNCAMPVDLFLDDFEEIKRIFVLDKYQFEEKKESFNGWYNHAEDNEYYRK